MQNNLCHRLSVVAAMEAMECNQCSLELEPLSGLVPCKPVRCDRKVPTMVTVGPNISSEADLSSCHLKVRSVARHSKKRLFIHTARSCFRSVNHDFHAVIMVSRIFVQ